MTTVFLHPYFLLGAVGLLAFAIFAARTSYVDTPTVEPENSDLLSRLANEVERARRLGYPLTVIRLTLRPGTSPAVFYSAVRGIDTVVVNDNVVHLLMPGCTDINPVMERLNSEAEAIAARTTATFPADALTIGELMLRIGVTSPSQNGQSSRNGHTSRNGHSSRNGRSSLNGSTPSAAVDDRTSVK